MRGALLAVVFSEAKPDFINFLSEVIRMNHDETVIITVAVIRDAILKIASEKPEWFYTEGWLKEILYRTPSNLKPKENFSSDLEHFKKLYEDNPCWDISRD